MKIKFTTTHIITSGFILASFLVYIQTVHAQDKSSERTLELSISAGFQKENFNWSIDGNNSQGNYINVLSELKWNNLKGPSVGTHVRWNIWKALVLQTNFSNTFITSGRVTDVDYDSSNRTKVIYDGLFKSDKGTITSFAFSGGYIFFKDKKYNFTLNAGCSASRQSLHILDLDANSGNKLNTTYKTWWTGFVLGVEGNIYVFNKLTVAPYLKYHQLKFNSEANWNLISEFQHPVSFTHTAKGFCFDSGLKLQYMFQPRWSIFLVSSYTIWDTGKGIDKLFKSDGQVLYTQLNGVNRNGYGFTIGVSKFFNY